MNITEAEVIDRITEFIDQLKSWLLFETNDVAPFWLLGRMQKETAF